MKIVIAAASGNIGRRTAEKVIQSGAETVLLARNPEKLADLVDSAEPTLRVGGAYRNDNRVVRFPYPSDHDIPWISTDDIGDVAARYLLVGGAYRR